MKEIDYRRISEWWWLCQIEDVFDEYAEAYDFTTINHEHYIYRIPLAYGVARPLVAWLVQEH